MTAAKLDELLDALGGEWSVGVARLNEFEHVFGNAEHVELLNLVGGAFFAEVQRILWDDLLLCVTRLTDPSRMRRKDPDGEQVWFRIDGGDHPPDAGENARRPRPAPGRRPHRLDHARPAARARHQPGLGHLPAATPARPRRRVPTRFGEFPLMG